MQKKTLVFTLFSALFSNMVSASEPQLQPLSLENVGEVRQFDVAETGDLALINQQGELFRFNGKQAQRLGQDYSPEISPEFAYGRVAAADSLGNFKLWTEQQTYHSTIPLAKQAHLLGLHFATIAVVKQNGQYHLARLETAGEQVKISAIRQDMAVLPDARPVQINLGNDRQDAGHIAVLAQPDSQVYQHGVLGDEEEAKAFYYLERHSLNDLAKPLVLKNAVFEANTIATLPHEKTQLAVTVISGDHGGASTALITEKQGELTLFARSQSLPSHRWQSPFVRQQKLYAIQMPHLARRLVHYQLNGDKLDDYELITGLSNHKIGEHETNLVASSRDFSVIPQADYRHITLWDHHSEQFSPIDTTLPARIVKTLANKEQVFLLLANGQVWTVR